MWVYGTYGQGRYQSMGDGSWVENNPSGSHTYQEMRRTPQFVELFDAGRDVTVRLFPDRMYYISSTNPVWQLGYVGGWR
jgi:hypothetical protein